ncbi:hypothetical protein C662_05230 [Thauera sp. 28]|nr:hypothetical protein C662_05230 [Thauera sp. 28]
MKHVALVFHCAKQSHEGALGHTHEACELSQRERLGRFREVFEDSERTKAANVFAAFVMHDYRVVRIRCVGPSAHVS